MMWKGKDIGKRGPFIVVVCFMSETCHCTESDAALVCDIILELRWDPSSTLPLFVHEP
jgi:hypothetical protein